MSANRILLACSHHKTFEEMLCLAERAPGDDTYTHVNPKRADEWFNKHAKCGNAPDTFQLAYQRTLNWDQALPAPESAAAVRMALLNGSHK